MPLTDEPVYRSLSRLREDALTLGMYDLARIYAQSILRINFEHVARSIMAMRPAGDRNG